MIIRIQAAVAAVFMLLFLQLNVMGQAPLVSENFSETSLESALKQMQKNYGLSIAYDPLAISGLTVDLRIRNKSVNESIGLLLEGTALQYKLDSQGNILIRKGDFPAQGIIAQVLDQGGEQAITSAAVVLLPSQLGTYTNDRGFFEFSSEELKGSTEIWVQYLGYRTEKIKLSDLSPLEELKVNLQKDKLKLSTVTVCAKVPSLQTAELGDRPMINARILDRLPHFANGPDLLRTIQLLPGINNTDDLSSGLEIRGSSSAQSLYLLDGIRLYKTDHFFGIFSNINEKIVEDMDLYMNAFPAEYGGKTAGVLSITSNTSQPSKITGSIDLSPLSNSAGLHLPIGKNVNLSLGMRRSNGNVANNKLYQTLTNNEQEIAKVQSGNDNAEVELFQQAPNYRFNDQNAKLTWQINNNNKVAVSAFASVDEFNNDFSYEIDKDQGPPLRQDFRESYDWKNQGISLLHQAELSQFWNSDLTLAFSDFGEQQELDAILRRPNPGDQDQEFQDSYKGALSSLEANWKNSFAIAETSLLSVGANFLQYDSKLELRQGQEVTLGQELVMTENSLYSQLNLGEGKAFSLQLGLRGTWIGKRSKVCVSPRIKAGYEATKHLSLKAAFGRYYQVLRELYYEDRFGRSMNFWVLSEGNDIPVLESYNSMLGLSYKKDKWLFDLEFYRKDIDGIVEFALEKPGAVGGNNQSQNGDGFKIYSGTGKTIGMDILWYRECNKGSSWFSYTLSKSENRFREIARNDPFPAQNDRRHQLNVVQMFELGQWQISGTYVFGSGRPYSDLSRLSKDRDRKDLRSEDRIKRLPNYHRVDLGLERKFELDGMELSVNLSIFNLLDYNNVKYVQFISSVAPPNNGGGSQGQNNPKPEVYGTEVSMLGRTPNLTIGIGF